MMAQDLRKIAKQNILERRRLAFEREIRDEVARLQRMVQLEGEQAALLVAGQRHKQIERTLERLAGE